MEVASYLTDFEDLKNPDHLNFEMSFTFSLPNLDHCITQLFINNIFKCEAAFRIFAFKNFWF